MSGNPAPTLHLALPEEYTARPPTATDVALVTQLIGACELAEIGSVEIDEEDVAGDWRRPDVAPEQDGVLVLDASQEPAAYAEVFAARAEGNVLPQHRGRGLGTSLAAWIERRAREQGASFVRQVIPATAQDRHALLESAGYEYTDTAWGLGIALAERPEPPSLPAGVEIRDFVPGDDDPAAWRVIEDAFAAWPNREPNTLEGWRATTVGRAGFEPWLFPLAVRGDEVVGGAFCIDYPEGGEGWVQQLAVREDMRGQGLGKALLGEAFARFATRGRATAGLSTDSRTGALDLYLGLGMHITREYHGMRLTL